MPRAFPMYGDLTAFENWASAVVESISVSLSGFLADQVHDLGLTENV